MSERHRGPLRADAMPLPFEHHPNQEPVIETVHGLEIDERSDIRRGARSQLLRQRCEACSHAKVDLARLSAAIFHCRFFRTNLTGTETDQQRNDQQEIPLPTTTRNRTHKTPLLLWNLN